MGIHQTVIGSYTIQTPAASDWEVFYVAEGNATNTIPAASLQENDLIVVVGGSDDQDVSMSYTNLTVTTLRVADTNSIEHRIDYGVVPSNPSSIQVSFPGNLFFGGAAYGLTMGFRKSGSSSTYSVAIKLTTTSQSRPSHNGTSLSFSAGSLALLLGLLDDDASSMDPPSVSTKIGEDQSGSGSIGAGYRQIDTAGNYSWGTWSTSSTDASLAFVIEIQES